MIQPYPKVVYSSPSHYLDRCEDAACSWRVIPPPNTITELRHLATHRPDLAWQVWPGPSVRAEYDLPDDPHDLTAEADRLLDLLADPIVRDAVRAALEAN